MAATAADRMVECLLEWGVDTVFGLPGDGINGIMESLRQCQERIRFVQVRHEETAALMACGYAKLTGRLGVCLATSGPGGIHLLNGLYDAKLDGAAVLAITGLQYHDLVHTHTQQDVELDKLFMDVCVYNARVMGPAHVENVMQLACRTAASRHGVAHVTMPVDMQSLPLKSDARSARNVRDHASMVGGRDIATPSDAQLRQAAAILAEGRKICILAGRGALARQDRTGEDRGAARGTCCQGAAWESGACRTCTPIARAGSACSGRLPPRKRCSPAIRYLSSAAAFRTSNIIPSPAAPAPCRSTGTARGSGFAIPSNAAWWAMPRPRSAHCLRCSGRTRTGAFWKRRKRACANGARA